MISILLIQPENKEINAFRKKQFNNFSQVTIPYLAAYIDESIYKITIVDEYNEKIPFEKTYDLVAITVNTPNAKHCYEISSAFQDSGAKVVMGGPHVTLLPDEAKLHCDYLIIGEGERTWPEFLIDFSKGEPKSLYQSSLPPDLANLPFPRWDLVKSRSVLMKGAVFATRGCPHSCAYCNLKQIYHDSFRTRPIEQVIEEIKRIKSRYFVFWDDNFFADKQYAIALMGELRKLNKRWAAQVTISSCDDDELLSAAKECGCLYLFVGLESFSNEALESVGKQINRTRSYKEIIAKMHSYHILIQAGIIFGFDTDTKDVFAKTLDACNQLGIDGVTVSLLTPFPKTPVYEQYRQEKRLLTDDWTYYNSKTSVVFLPKKMTEKELLDGYFRFRKEFYSLKSFVKRMRVSKTRLVLNAFMNFGYYLSI